MDAQSTIEGIAGWLLDCLKSAAGQLVTGGIAAAVLLLWCLLRSPWRSWQIRRSFSQTSGFALGLPGFGITLENKSRVPVKVLRVALTSDNTHFILEYSGKKTLVRRTRFDVLNGKKVWRSESIRSFDALEVDGGVDLDPGMAATWYLHDECPLDPGDEPLAGHVMLQYQTLFRSRRNIEVEFEDRDKITRALRAQVARRAQRFESPEDFE